MPLLSELDILVLTDTNEGREAGQKVTEARYVVANRELVPNGANDMTFPSAPIKLIMWEGTCNLAMTHEGIIKVEVGSVADGWWGCGLEVQADKGEDLTEFKSGKLNFEIKGNTNSSFNVGFQSGRFAAGNQINNFVTFGPDSDLKLKSEWKSHSLPVADLIKDGDLSDVTNVFYFHGEEGGDGKSIQLRNVSYSRK